LGASAGLDDLLRRAESRELRDQLAANLRHRISIEDQLIVPQLVAITDRPLMRRASDVTISRRMAGLFRLEGHALNSG